jgi:hypothetical protein
MARLLVIVLMLVISIEGFIVAPPNRAETTRRISSVTMATTPVNVPPPPWIPNVGLSALIIVFSYGISLQQATMIKDEVRMVTMMLKDEVRTVRDEFRMVRDEVRMVKDEVRIVSNQQLILAGSTVVAFALFTGSSNIVDRVLEYADEVSVVRETKRIENVDKRMQLEAATKKKKQEEEKRKKK